MNHNTLSKRNVSIAQRSSLKENLNFRCIKSQITGLKKFQSKYSLKFSYVVLEKKVYRNQKRFLKIRA